MAYWFTLGLVLALVGTALFFSFRNVGSRRANGHPECECPDCPFGKNHDPLVAVGLVLTGMVRHCTGKAPEAHLIRQAIAPLATTADHAGQVAEEAVSTDGACCHVECTLSRLAPVVNANFKFAERGQIVSMVGSVIRESGGQAECVEKALPLVRRKLSLSAR